MNISCQPDPSDPSETGRYEIRAMQQSDLFEVSGILAESFPLSPEFLQWLIPIMRVGIQEDLRSRLRSASPHYSCFVVVDRERSDYLVGTVEVAVRNENPWSPKANQYVYLSNLAVRSEYRRQGIALKMLVKCDAVVRKWGFQSVYLHVLETNHSARQLYWKLGYRLQEAQSGFTSLLFGQPRRLFLKKQLN